MEKRKAIGVHKTGTTDGAWDGPANEGRLKTDQAAAYYGRAFAWRDPEGDEKVKASYRFIHHEVSGEGEPGAANMRACITGIAVLNGARGGTTIPEADKVGVWRHLAAHLRDGDREPPELKSVQGGMERRSYECEELRSEDGESGKIVGYAAVFDKLSEPMFGFRERIRRGAFRKTVKDGADVRALWNHNADYVLGRTKSGTLALKEDEHGLHVEIDPPATQWANDFRESIRRGDVSQMSFGFQVVKEKWSGEEEPIRELLEVKLFDVSPVTFPAYPETVVAARALRGIGIEVGALELAVASGERQEILRAIAALGRCLPDDNGEPDQVVHSAVAGEPDQAVHSEEAVSRSLRLLRLRLDVAVCD